MNSNFKSAEFSHPYILIFSILQTCSIYIIGDENENIIYKIPKVIRNILGFPICYVALGVYIYKSFQRDTIDISELAITLPIFVVGTQTILKATILLFYRKKIEKLILNLDEIWRTDNLSEKQVTRKMKLVKQLKLFHLAFYWVNLVVSIQYLFLPIFLSGFKTLILQKEFDWPFPVACSLPFDMKKNILVYMASYSYQVFSMYCLVSIYVGSELLMITLCAQLSIEFTLLQDDILNINTKEKMDKGLQTIAEFSKIHQKLIALAQSFDEIFNKMVFVNFFFAQISICFFCFSAKVVKDLTTKCNNFAGSIASTVPIYILCYHCELLNGASSEIANAAYVSSWYQNNVRHQKSISLIILRSSRPCSLRSLTFPVTLKTFSNILSTIWSYFSLISSLYEE